MRAAVSLGANLGDRRHALEGARRALVDGTGAVATSSSLYETAPVGGVEQPDFLNAVVVLDVPGADESGLAWQLLGIARTVEESMHRVREVRWGPRPIDVDILAVGSLQSADPELTVPHPRIAERAFVLVPWAEIDPEFEVPGLGTVSRLLSALPAHERAEVRLVQGTRA